MLREVLLHSCISFSHGTHSIAIHALWSLFLLSDNLQIALAFSVEIHLLDVTNLLLQSLILESICVNLWLVVLQLRHHVLQLLGTLLKVLLVHLQLVSHFWAWLLGQDVLQLYVQLLLLLDQHILLWYLLCLCDKSLLQTLDLLNHLMSLWVGTLQLSPSVHVKRLLDLVKEKLRFLLLLQELFLKKVNLSL